MLLDNPQVRILDVHLKAGAKTPMHSHPGHAIYALNDAKVKFTSSDGKTSEVQITAGQTVWHAAETHAAENVGTTELHVIDIEIKSPGAAAHPATTKKPAK